MKTITKTWEILSPTEQRRVFVVFGLAIAMAVFEVVSVLAILPFLAVASDPTVIETNATLSKINEFWGSRPPKDFLVLLGSLAFGLLIAAAIVRTTAQFFLIRFAQMRRYSISRRLVASILSRPYAAFLTRHTSDMVKTTLAEVEQIISNVLVPMVQIVGALFTLLTILALLIIVDPVVTIVACVVLGGAYFLIYLTTRGLIQRTGQMRAIANNARFKVATEIFGGIKGIKLMGREATYLDQFTRASHEYSKHMARAQTVSQLPRYGVEVVAIGGILLLTIFLLVREGGADTGAFQEIVPTLGLFAFAGYRILPSLQSLYAASSQIRFGAAALDAVHEELTSGDEASFKRGDGHERLQFHTGLNVKDLAFSYEGETTGGISGVTFHLPKGASLGIIGGTGAGKTTLIDLILGLLDPTSGRVAVDDTEISASNRRNWQAGLGYVPQDIFLIDESVANNIAFGLPEGSVVMKRVEASAKLAHVHDFVLNEMKQGYQTHLGDRGVRLSGGQRQRIGIARALYSQPDVLILDEATSALDTVTETSIMKAVDELAGEKTLIMIAHRLSTVQNCDYILVLDRGRQSGFGTYEEMRNTNPIFRSMIQAADAG